MIDQPRYKFAEKWAEKLLKKYPYGSPPVDVWVIACGEGLEVELRYDWPATLKLHGVVQGTVIGINGKEARVRQRFTLAHELGHICPGHHRERGYVPTIDSPESEVNPYPQHLEREASSFANALLVPKALLVKALLQHRTIPPLSSVFEVSHQVMTIALNRTGLMSRLA